MKSKIKSSNGITLLTLVITIVILIILATIAVQFAFGDRGLIKQAELAKDMTLNSIYVESEGMNTLIDEYANMIEDSRPKEYGELEIGDYVKYDDLYLNYNKVGNGYIFNGETAVGWDQSYARNIESKTIEFEGNNIETGWRVLKKDGNTLTLICASTSTPQSVDQGRIIYKGETLYNNGVSAVNRLCDYFYSVDGIGKARNITIEDINEITGYTYTGGSTREYTGDNARYPTRFIYDKGSAVDTDTVKQDGFTPSEIGLGEGTVEVATNIKAYSGYKQATNKIITTQHAYSYNISDYVTDEIQKELLAGTDNRHFWIATRAIDNTSQAHYGMFYMNSGNVTFDWAYSSDNYGASDVTTWKVQKAHWYRPVVEIDLSKVNIDLEIKEEDNKETKGTTPEQAWPISIKE